MLTACIIIEWIKLEDKKILRNEWRKNGSECEAREKCTTRRTDLCQWKLINVNWLWACGCASHIYSFELACVSCRPWFFNEMTNYATPPRTSIGHTRQKSVPIPVRTFVNGRHNDDDDNDENENGSLNVRPDLMVKSQSGLPPITHALKAFMSWNYVQNTHHPIILWDTLSFPSRRSRKLQIFIFFVDK